MPSQDDEYAFSSRGPIRLKETKRDKAERLYRREQKRYRKEQERISRANGYAVSPPRGREESITPPRNAPRPEPQENDDDDIQWMGGHARAARETMDRLEEQERMEWLAQEEIYRGNPFGSIGSAFADAHVPLRHRAAAGMPGPSRSRRDPTREVEFEGGGVPDMSGMDEEEYAEWVRVGMYRKTHKAELERQEKVRKERQERERIKEEARETARRVERRRMEKIRQEKGKAVEDRKRAQRDRYRSRWASIGEVGGDIEETELTFGDIPWPVYANGTVVLEDLEMDPVRSFFEAIATDRGEGDDELKKVLRDAIRAFHPDRFFARILPRVSERDREMVKEGVEVCSRIINALAARAS